MVDFAGNGTQQRYRRHPGIFAGESTFDKRVSSAACSLKVCDLTMASDGSIANTTLKGLSAHYEPALGCKSCIWVWLCIHLFVINNNLTAFSGYYWKIGHFSTEVRQHRVLLQPLKTHCITSLIVSSVLFTLCSNPFTSAKAIKAHHAGTLANKCDLFEPPLTISTNWVSITYSYRHSFNMQM